MAAIFEPSSRDNPKINKDWTVYKEFQQIGDSVISLFFPLVLRPPS